MLGLKTLTSLPVDSPIRVKVRAKNGKGFGQYSEVNSVGQTIESIPSVMSAPTVLTSSVTTSSIPLTWTTPSGISAGGSLVTVSSYDLWHSTDGSTWLPLVTGHTTTSYAHTITPSSLLNYYTIKANNKYGNQTTASPATAGIKGTSVPATPAMPTLTEDGTSVSIVWTAPDSNYDTITAYKVFIITFTGSYVESTAACDGSLPLTV